MAASARDQVARVVHAQREAPAPNAPVSEAPGAQPHADDVSARRTETAPAAVEATGAKPKSALRKKIVIGVSAVVALGLIYAGVHYMTVGRYMVSTDDAYVRANNTTLGARVSGHIAAVEAGDNVRVAAGDVVLRIDDGDYRIAVDNARARIATQEATIARIMQQATAQESAVEQAKAQLASADAATKRAEADFARQETLTARGFASKATFDLSQASRDQAVAAVQGAQATLDAAQAQVAVIKAQQAEAEAQLRELRAALAKALRDLSFTVVRAPVDGVFANRIVNVGDFVQPGQRLASIVPLDQIYIDANYKETQLGRLKPGQPVKITVDAVSGRTINGIVDSVAPASGSVFTLLPPDNATGNFTKIAQRIPVRIAIDEGQDLAKYLAPGLSVEVTTVVGE